MNKPRAPQKDSEGKIDETDTLIWKKEVDEYVRRKNALLTNKEQAYSLLWGQSTDVIKAKLEACDNYEEMNDDNDLDLLLKNMKRLVYRFEDHKYIPDSLHTAQKNFYNFFQYSEMDNTTYLEKFNSLIKVIESYGGSIGDDKALEKLYPTYNTLSSQEKKAEAKKDVKQRYLSYCFLKGSDSVRYGKMKEDLENDYSQGNNKYPHTITEAYQFLMNYKQYKPKESYSGNNNSGMSFVNNNNNNNESSNTEWHKTATCHNCKKKGHIKPNCPDYKTESANVNTNNNDDNNDATGVDQMCISEENDFMEGEEFGNNQFCFHTTRLTEAKMKKILLLDTGSSDHLFCEEKLLKNVHHKKDGIAFSSNGGIMKSNRQGELANTNQKAWVNNKSITNILSFFKIAKAENMHVTYDNKK